MMRIDRAGRMTALTLALGLLLGGCARDEGVPPATAADEDAPAGAADGGGELVAGEAHGIVWHGGNVDSAFARAAAEDKPLFLYWGAEWCPPCGQIKATIFSKPEFIEKSRLFVPVYIDGDAPGAQALGERFGVLGYPTMIVFDSAGRELTRIPGGLDIQLYGSVLDLTLQDVRPVGEALDAVLAGRPVSEDDCRLLAYYSWEQDNERVLAGRDPATTYRALADACPARLAAESARLYVAYITAALDAARREDEPLPLTPEQKAEALTRVSGILADDEVATANLFMVLYRADDVVAGLTDARSDERDRLMALWQRRLDALEADPSVSTAHRLATALTRIRLARMEDPAASPSPALQQRALEQVARADAAATTSYERQAVINTAWYVLTEAGLEDEASALFTAELEKSSQPYYFMLDLADLAEKAGREDEALAWLERAYLESEGPATRFQWGYSYVVGLLEMTPEDGERIEGATIEVLGELDDPDNAIYNRTARIMGRLGDRLTAWNEEGRYAEHVARIRDRATEICAGVPPGEAARQTCEEFLAVTCGEAAPAADGQDLTAAADDRRC